MTSATSSINGMDIVKDTYIPVFTNRPADYREWRQRILLYKKKSDLNKKGKEAVINLLTSLSGIAWRQVEPLVEKATEAEDGFTMILNELDKTFRYDDQVEMPRAFEKFFFGLQRKDGQTLLNYVADHREALSEVEKHGVVIPDKIAGWLLLRRAGLSVEQKQMIQGRAAELTQKAVQEAFYFLLGQDYKGRSYDSKTWKTGKGHGSNRWGRNYGYMTEEIYGMEDYDYEEDPDDDEEQALWEQWEDESPEDVDYSLDENYMTYDPDDAEGETEFMAEVEMNYEDAYATYLDARRQMANLKASRGYYPVVALADTSSMPSSPSSQQPFAPRPKGKGKGKGKSKKGKGRGLSSPWQSKGAPVARGQAASKCLRCHQPGHWAIDCPNPPKNSPTNRTPSSTTSSPAKKAKTDGAAMMVRDMAKNDQRGLSMLGPHGWYGLQDGGASSVVCGHETLMSIIDYMCGRGMSTDRYLFMATNKTFGFGGDATRQSDWSVRLPVYINDKAGYMECFVIEGSTPLLIGRPILQALKVKMNYEDNQMTIQGGPWKETPLGHKGEYLLRLDDGIEADPTGSHVDFDFITDETIAAINNYEDLSDYISLQEYLATTNRSPPELALHAKESEVESPETISVEPTSDLSEEDPTEVRRPITDRLVKTIHMNFNHFNRQRKSMVEQALHAHEQGKRIFWEVYSGSGNLSAAMAAEGWVAQCFDINNGWNFEDSSHRREFIKLLDVTCPDFVWFAPPCTVWSSLQNLNIDTPEKQEALQADRDFQETTHLKMSKRGYLKQQREGRHAALEQPRYALSWKTKTLESMPGFDSDLDQCQFGCTLPDQDYIEQYIKKPTRLRCTDETMALDLGRLCTQDHYHLPIEGTSPGIGSRAEAAGVYQPHFCYSICCAIIQIFHYKGHDTFYASKEVEMPDWLMDEDEQPGEDLQEHGGHPSSPEEDPPPLPHGVLRRRLHDENWQNAKRTVMRLHRNLGHPTSRELVRLLQNKNASSALLEAAQQHECPICNMHRRPTGVPVSSMPKNATFNHRVQADTLWIKVPGMKHQQPVLMMSDSTTRLIAARHLRGGEKTEEFIKQLERAWIRNFGPMQVLQVDEHRAWSSDRMREWCTENGIHLQVSPGQAHTRLAILERRHQVTRRAVTLFLHGNPTLASDPDGLVTALNYVIPQINRTPNVCGFSPIQWTMGYTPHIPGLLMEEQSLHNPAHMDPSEKFMEKLKLQQEAAKAIVDADIDRRLQRALLRKFMGQQTILNTGDLCYYWRDAPAGSPAKLRWRGPATVIMRETGPHGPNSDVYWLGHGTVLLRAAPEHVKPAQPVQDMTERAKDPLHTAKDALQNIRNRGVTHYIDLGKTNKRRREEVDSDEEEGIDDRDYEGVPIHDLPEDRWQPSHDGRMWTRIHNTPRKQLYVPTPTADVPVHLFKTDRITDVRRGSPNPEHLRIRDDWTQAGADRELHYVWTGTTTFLLDPENITDEDDYAPTTPRNTDDENLDTEETENLDDDSRGGSIQSTTSPGAPIARPSVAPGLQHDPGQEHDPGLPPVPESPMSQSEAEPNSEPDMPTSNLDPTIEIPSAQQQVYLPGTNETFEQQRARVNRQETLLFRAPNPPLQSVPEQQPEEYGPQRRQADRETPYSQRPLEDEKVDFSLDVDLLTQTDLPHGWSCENGYLQLGEIQDEWKIEGNYLTRYHYVSRDKAFQLSPDNCPIPIHFLTKQRITKITEGPIVRDKWARTSPVPKLTGHQWTGYTRFKIHACHRRAAKQTFLTASNGTESIYLQEDKNSNSPLSERTMSLSDRMAFQQAKQKELASFFENEVWTFDSQSNAVEGRTLRAKFILNWKKNPDGTPRAKARLICQGFRDPDALNGSLMTASPTLTRLSRSMILSLTAIMGFFPFTADITTAFLQGKKYDPDSNRVLWIRLPRDADSLLGLPAGHDRVMKLIKPMYGLVDAPKAWFDEAVDRILHMGQGSIIQHPLDGCLFMAYDRPIEVEQAGNEPPRLLAIFGLHVDDLLGCCNEDDPKTKELMEKLRSIFSFREWHSGKEMNELTYCGASITKVDEHHWKIGHETYIKKMKPITIPKDRLQTNLPVTENERTALRGLLGGLQWPSTQTCPWLQSQVSMMAGSITKATTETLESANKTLRFAKSNCDVGLEYRPLGKAEDMTFVAYSDASFACRTDLSSQGGFMVMMVNKDIQEGAEGHYNLMDWRSWKLARVARSTLSAESQAASEAADALLFATTFWTLIFKPWMPLDSLETPKLKHRPSLVVDAKALYDLLIKPEVQASSGTDKRTTIEVLVTQDKLTCSNALTKWVSSEQQYADGLTKASAAQLLADRLRTHLVRLRSDTTFQASKKKTPQERKKNAEMYAAKKPGRAMTAMFAVCMATTTAAETPEHHNITTNYHYIDLNFDFVKMLYTAILAIFLGILLLHGFRATWSMWTSSHAEDVDDAAAEEEHFQEVSNPAVTSSATQTDLLGDDIVELTYHLAEIERIDQEYMPRTVHEQQLAAAHRDLDRVHEQRTQERQQLEHQFRYLTQNPVYFTRHGRCWHSDPECLRRWSTTPLQQREYCVHCAHYLGRGPVPLPDGNT